MQAALAMAALVGAVLVVIGQGCSLGCRSSAGFECTCAAGAEGGGLEWQCTDTGFPCTPGSP